MPADLYQHDLILINLPSPINTLSVTKEAIGILVVYLTFYSKIKKNNINV